MKKRTANIKIPVLQLLIKLCCIIFFVFLSNGCEVNRVMTEVGGSPKQNFPILVSIQPCIDRTGTEVIDLGGQATETFKEGLNATNEFSVVSSGNYILFCEVTDFDPGNAVKRWIWPGLGTTVGRISTMIQDAKSGEVLIIIEGKAIVGSGGLYTVGAWNYIIPTAVKDTVRQLQAWVDGGQSVYSDDHIKKQE